MQVSVVKMQPRRFDTGQLANELVQRRRRLAGRDAGAAHADIEVEPDGKGDAGGLGGLGQVADRFGVVGDG